MAGGSVMNRIKMFEKSAASASGVRSGTPSRTSILDRHQADNNGGECRDDGSSMRLTSKQGRTSTEDACTSTGGEMTSTAMSEKPANEPHSANKRAQFVAKAKLVASSHSTAVAPKEARDLSSSVVSPSVAKAKLVASSHSTAAAPNEARGMLSSAISPSMARRLESRKTPLKARVPKHEDSHCGRNKRAVEGDASHSTPVTLQEAPDMSVASPNLASRLERRRLLKKARDPKHEELFDRNRQVVVEGDADPFEEPRLSPCENSLKAPKREKSIVQDVADESRECLKPDPSPTRSFQRNQLRKSLKAVAQDVKMDEVENPAINWPSSESGSLQEKSLRQYAEDELPLPVEERENGDGGAQKSTRSSRPSISKNRTARTLWRDLERKKSVWKQANKDCPSPKRTTSERSFRPVSSTLSPQPSSKDSAVERTNQRLENRPETPEKESLTPRARAVKHSLERVRRNAVRQNGSRPMRQLKQSLGDASTVLQEERESSVGSGSSRSSLSVQELSSIASRALQAAKLHESSRRSASPRKPVEAVSGDPLNGKRQPPRLGTVGTVGKFDSFHSSATRTSVEDDTPSKSKIQVTRSIRQPQDFKASLRMKASAVARQSVSTLPLSLHNPSSFDSGRSAKSPTNPTASEKHEDGSDGSVSEMSKRSRTRDSPSTQMADALKLMARPHSRYGTRTASIIGKPKHSTVMHNNKSLIDDASTVFTATTAQSSYSQSSRSTKAKNALIMAAKERAERAQGTTRTTPDPTTEVENRRIKSEDDTARLSNEPSRKPMDLQKGQPASFVSGSRSDDNSETNSSYRRMSSRASRVAAIQRKTLPHGIDPVTTKNERSEVPPLPTVFTSKKNAAHRQHRAEILARAMQARASSPLPRVKSSVQASSEAELNRKYGAASSFSSRILSSTSSVEVDTVQSDLTGQSSHDDDASTIETTSVKSHRSHRSTSDRHKEALVRVRAGNLPPPNIRRLLDPPAPRPKNESINKRDPEAKLVSSSSLDNGLESVGSSKSESLSSSTKHNDVQEKNTTDTADAMHEGPQSITEVPCAKGREASNEEQEQAQQKKPTSNEDSGQKEEGDPFKLSFARSSGSTAINEREDDQSQKENKCESISEMSESRKTALDSTALRATHVQARVLSPRQPSSFSNNGVLTTTSKSNAGQTRVDDCCSDPMLAEVEIHEISAKRGSDEILVACEEQEQESEEPIMMSESCTVARSVQSATRHGVENASRERTSVVSDDKFEEPPVLTSRSSESGISRRSRRSSVSRGISVNSEEDASALVGDFLCESGSDDEISIVFEGSNEDDLQTLSADKGSSDRGKTNQCESDEAKDDHIHTYKSLADEKGDIRRSQSSHSEGGSVMHPFDAGQYNKERSSVHPLTPNPERSTGPEPEVQSSATETTTPIPASAPSWTGHQFEYNRRTRLATPGSPIIHSINQQGQAISEMLEEEPSKEEQRRSAYVAQAESQRRVSQPVVMDHPQTTELYGGTADSSKKSSFLESKSSTSAMRKDSAAQGTLRIRSRTLLSPRDGRLPPEESRSNLDDSGINDIFNGVETPRTPYGDSISKILAETQARYREPEIVTNPTESSAGDVFSGVVESQSECSYADNGDSGPSSVSPPPAPPKDHLGSRLENASPEVKGRPKTVNHSLGEGFDQEPSTILSASPKAGMQWKTKSGSFGSKSIQETVHFDAGEEKTDMKHSTSFFKFGWNIVDSLTLGMCRQPGKQMGDTTGVSSDEDDHDHHDLQFTEKIAAGGDSFTIASYSINSGSGNHLSMAESNLSAKERKRWDDWDRRESRIDSTKRNRQVTVNTRTSPNREGRSEFPITHPIAPAKKDWTVLKSSVEKTDDAGAASVRRGVSRLVPDSRIMLSMTDQSETKDHFAKKGKSTTVASDKVGGNEGDTRAVEASRQQKHILDTVTKRLQEHGIEVLKLSKDKKWQVRYLTITSETQKVPGIEGTVPIGLLWQKKFQSRGKLASVDSIDVQGHGGLLVSSLEKVTASSSKVESTNPLPKRFEKRFRDSIAINIQYTCNGSSRALVLRCRTKEDAHILCTGLRIVLDRVRPSHRESRRRKKSLPELHEA